MTDTSLWIETDTHGVIHGIAPGTARLLGLSQRGAHARDLRLFFPTAYRPLSALLRDAEEHVVEASYPLYPRDRRPVQVHVRISPAPSPTGHPLLRWTLSVQLAGGVDVTDQARTG
jgi:hypothetical protein